MNSDLSTKSTTGGGADRVMSEITRLRDAMKKGQTSERADISNLDGDTRVLLWRVNDMLDAITVPFGVVSKYLKDIVKGKIPPILTDSYGGNFDDIKNDINAVIRILEVYEQEREQPKDIVTEPQLAGSINKRTRWFRKRISRTLNKIIGSIFIVFLASCTAHSQSLPRLSASIFGDYYYNVENHLPSSRDMQAFDYRRINVGAYDSLAPRLSGEFKVESQLIGTAPGRSALTLDVKDAYLTWSTLPWSSDIRLGIQPTPAIDAADGLFGYRSLEKSIEDLHDISSPRDFGVSVVSHITKIVSAEFMIGNNSGNSPASNRYKRAYLQFSFKPVGGLEMVFSGDYAGAPAAKYLRTGDVIISYSTIRFSIGSQAYVQDIDHNAYEGTTSYGGTSQTYGLGIEGWVAVIRNLRFVGRCDYWNPGNAYGDTGTNPLHTPSTLLMAALDFSYSKNVHIIPNLVDTEYDLPGCRPDITARATLYLSY